VGWGWQEILWTNQKGRKGGEICYQEKEKNKWSPRGIREKHKQRFRIARPGPKKRTGARGLGGLGEIRGARKTKKEEGD